MRIAFSSPHCLIDFTSGAAVATLRAVEMLAQSGFECRAFCGSQLDAREETLIEESLARQGCQYRATKTTVGRHDVRLIFAEQGRVDVTIFQAFSTRGDWGGPERVEAYLECLRMFLDENQPDVLLTYGGNPVSQAAMQVARSRRIPIVFALHNLSYRNRAILHDADHFIVPSQFAADHYRKTLGIAPHVLPNVLPPNLLVAADPRPQYVTFVNPHPSKGLALVARIAQQLADRRPDIPLLIVEGRGQVAHLVQTGMPATFFRNVHRMENSPDPRSFYRLTRVLLMPSLVEESFGLVAAEGMLNGIPVLASDRGALPETVGDGGFLFHISDCYTPFTTQPPPAEEVEPWIDMILRLWDDPAFYAQASRAARQRAARWLPEQLAPAYRDFFRSVGTTGP